MKAISFSMFFQGIYIKSFPIFGGGTLVVSPTPAMETTQDFLLSSPRALAIYKLYLATEYPMLFGYEMVLDLIIAFRNPQIDKRKLIDHSTFRSIISYFEKGCDPADTAPELTENKYGHHILSFLQKKRQGSGMSSSKLEDFQGAEVGSPNWTGETQAWFLLIVRKYLLQNFGKEITFFKRLPMDKLPSSVAISSDIQTAQEDILSGVARAKYKKKKADLQKSGMSEEAIGRALPLSSIPDDPIFHLSECKMNPTSMWADSSEIDWVSGLTQYLAYCQRFGIMSIGASATSSNGQQSGRTMFGPGGLGHFPIDLNSRVEKFGTVEYPGEGVVNDDTHGDSSPSTPGPFHKATTGMVAGSSLLLFSPSQTEEL